MSETETTETNDLSKRRRVNELTEQIADLCKDAGERFLELHDIGVDTRDVVQLVASHLRPEVRDMILDQSDSLSFSVDTMYMVATTPLPKNDDDRREASKKYAATMAKYETAFTGGGGAGGIVGTMYNQVQELVDRKVRDPSLGRLPMDKVIDRLFAEAPKLLDNNGLPIEGQAPALECFIVLIGGITIQGSLSRTPENTFRMLTPTDIQDPKTKRQRTVMAEQFFTINEVVSIVLQREMSMSAGSSIIGAS